jgi:hypothetical protein
LGARLLFAIQAHQRSEYLVALSRFLAQGEHQVLLQFDGSEEDVAALSAALSDRAVAVRRSIAVQWGGVSMVDALFDLMRAGVELGYRWTHIVHLSGDCLPLMSLDDMAAACGDLARRRKSAAFNLLHTSGALFYEDMQAPPGPQPQPPEVVLSTRAPVSAPADAMTLLRHPELRPTINWRYRLGLHFSEDREAGRFAVRRLHWAERCLIGETDTEFPLRGGRAWFICSRRICKAILNSPLTFRLRGHFAHGFCVDELFLQTLLISGGLLPEEELEPSNFRYLDGTGKRLNDAEDFEALATGRFMFARKYVARDCVRIARLSEARSGFVPPAPAETPA